MTFILDKPNFAVFNQLSGLTTDYSSPGALALCDFILCVLWLPDAFGPCPSLRPGLGNSPDYPNLLTSKT